MLSKVYVIGIAFALFALTNQIDAKENVCYWSGTSPFCAGVCKPGETTIKPSSAGDGRPCVTGQKVYCCPAKLGVAPANTVKEGCVWKGVAPFCSGFCDAGFKVEQVSDIGEGQPCWSGKKALCCPINS